eukprot:SAG31_NODE_65_length_28565_cov_8.402914_8_plen_109_part_00
MVDGWAKGQVTYPAGRIIDVGSSHGLLALAQLLAYAAVWHSHSGALLSSPVSATPSARSSSLRNAAAATSLLGLVASQASRLVLHPGLFAAHLAPSMPVVMMSTSRLP